MAISGGNNQEGVFDGQLDDPLVVKVTDGRGSAISGLPVRFPAEDQSTGMFIPVPGTTVYTTSASVLTGTLTTFTTVATATRPKPGVAIRVTNRFQRRSANLLPVSRFWRPPDCYCERRWVYTYNPSEFLRLQPEGGERRPTLSILSGNNQRTDEHGDIKDALVVVVRKDGNLLPGETVTFATSKGTLIGYSLGTDGSATATRREAKRVYANTDGSGEAEVTYYQDPGSGSDTVTATISGDNYEREVTFNINGSGGSRPSPPSGPSEPSNAITITLSETTGAPGDEIDVTISASPNTVVVIDSGDLDGDDFSREFGTTPFDTVISLPDEDDEYTFTAEATGYTSDSATVTVETGILGTISISQIGTPSNGAQSFSITVVDTDSARIRGSLTVRVSGSGFTTRNVDTLNGVGNARLTLPTAASLYTLTASAEGYTSGTTQVRNSRDRTAASRR